MNAPVLTLSEQKKALSGKNKKKKIKNILGLPTNVKVESPLINSEEAKKLGDILYSLLPSARIPNLQINKNEEKEYTLEMKNAIEEAKNKRKELSLGVNDLNRSIKKDLISAAIFASDISPKFLVQHLNLLCIHNKVPFLHMPDLRKVTKKSLGFPCIALGFRKNFNYFIEAIKKIRTIAEIKKIDITTKKNIENESNESDEETLLFKSPNINLIKSESDIPFQFLYRNSPKERVFIPENKNNCRIVKKQELDFISVSGDTSENEEKIEPVLKGISDNIVRKQKSNIEQEEIINLQNETSSSEEEYNLPKKKPKKSLISLKQNFKYSSANVIKVHSNPDRKKKKKNNYVLK